MCGTQLKAIVAQTVDNQPTPIPGEEGSHLSLGLPGQLPLPNLRRVGLAHSPPSELIPQRLLLGLPLLLRCPTLLVALLLPRLLTRRRAAHLHSKHKLGSSASLVEINCARQYSKDTG